MFLRSGSPDVTKTPENQPLGEPEEGSGVLESWA